MIPIDLIQNVTHELYEDKTLKKSQKESQESNTSGTLIQISLRDRKNLNLRIKNESFPIHFN